MRCDMTIDRIWKSEKLRALVSQSWALSWPLTFIMFYEFLIGLSDVYVAGKFGKSAQAAYGFAFQGYFIFIMIGIALSVGIVSVVSRLFTSGRQDEFATAITSSIVMSAAFGLAFTAAGFFFSGRLIGVLNLPAELKTASAPLVRIYSLAFAADYVLMSAAGIMRSCGMVMKSLWIMTVVCVMNIALNFTLSFATPLGLNGIAVATVISLATGAVLGLLCLRPAMARPTLSPALAKKILEISWPSGLLQALWQFGALVLFLILGMLPARTVEIMAALTNGLKIESAIFLPAFAFSMAAAVVVGNLLGKGEDRDAFRSGIVTAVMGVGIVSLMTVIVMMNARGIASFLSDNAAVAEESVRYIYIALLSEPVMAWMVILGGALNGAGDTMSVMLVTALSVWLVRIPLAYILGIHFGLGIVAIWWVMNLSALVHAVFITAWYFNRRWITRAREPITA